MNSVLRVRLSEVGALSTARTVAATIFCCLPFATGIDPLGPHDPATRATKND